MAIEPAQPVPPPSDDASRPLIGRGWVQGVALVMIFGFLAMGILAYRTYAASMPTPSKVVSQSGWVLVTGAEITRGQELFQARGLQEYGSIVGHGAYLGPDYTAEYLRMATDDVAAQLRTLGVGDPRETVVREFRTNRYDRATGTLVFTDHQVDNGPTAQLIVWSALSLVALLGGIGIMFAVYGRRSQKLGRHGAEGPALSFRQPGEVTLTPAQRATVWFFAIVSVLFLAQALLGAAAQHYRADLSSVFGLDLARLLPYNLARTWPWLFFFAGLAIPACYAVGLENVARSLRNGVSMKRVGVPGD